jgi:hypothetical protein
MAFNLLIAFQTLQVAILWLHDWVPLGSLNHVGRVQAEDTKFQLVKTTLIQSVPFTLGLFFSLSYVQTHHPAWTMKWLWISYAILFAGELRAWWVPYLVRPEPARAERYAKMFGGTHAFLPARNGIVPNTLHCLLHAATAGTLVLLALITFRFGS